MEILVPIVFFGFLGAIILVPIYLRERTKQSAHHLISQALEKGQPLDPETMKQLMATQGNQRANQPDRPRRTLGWGVVLLALAGGFVAAYYGTNADSDGFLIAASILGALGGAFTLLAIVDYITKRKDA